MVRLASFAHHESARKDISHLERRNTTDVNPWRFIVTLRRWFTLAVIVVFSFVSAGCRGSVKDENRIIMWLVGSEAQARTIMELGEVFSRETGVKVLCEAISWGDAHSKYLISIAGEVTPDIGTMGLTWGMEFGALGAMVDLKEKFPEDIAQIEKKIFPGLLEATQLGSKVYGIPFDFSEQIMYYRTDMIDQPPRTWAELTATIRKLKSENKGMLLDWGSLEWIGYAPFLWQAGGDFYNSVYTKVTLDTAEASMALDYFASLYNDGVPKTMVPLEQGMRTGDYPLAISGNWKIISLTVGAPEIKGKWSIAMLPKGPTGKMTTFVGGRVMGVFAQSRMKTESWQFIKFLFRPENQIKIYEASLDTEDAYLPPNMDTWKSLPMDAEFKQVLQKQAKDAKGPPPVLTWDSSTRFVNEAIQMVILKGAESHTQLKKATGSMQSELEGKL